MSPRTFIGIIGALLIVGAFFLAYSYEPVATAAGRTVPCGTLQHPDTPGSWQANLESRAKDPTPTNYNSVCAEKRGTVRLATWGMGIMGTLTLIGATFVRFRKPTYAESSE